ncbi:MAG: BatA domain-containing protein, partial [Flavobacteriaceae bacterium]
MQLKYPELLWALLLLLIPIFIHLFQLRRFKKTAFTNVRVLQRIRSESRKSKTLKKWLLLLTRMVIFTALVLAFAQPFLAANSALQPKETVIYLDDSFSTQYKKDNASLMENAVQDLIKSLPEDERFTLFTNQKTYKDVKIGDIQNELLAISHTEKQLKLSDISLKANTFFSKAKGIDKNLILISDFQDRIQLSPIDTSNTVHTHLVRLHANDPENIAIDSVYFSSIDPENLELTAILSSSGTTESTPVSLYNDLKLIAKTSAVFNDNQVAEVKFALPANQPVKGSITLSDTG